MNFDGHSDIWTDVTIRHSMGESNVLENQHRKRLQKGQIEGSIFVAWIDPPYEKNPKARLKQIFAAANKELVGNKNFVRVKSYEELIAARKMGKFYIIQGMEGLSGLEDSASEVERVYEENQVRHMSLTWNEENQFATGAGGSPERGITPLGKEAVSKIYDQGILLDVSHANDRTFWDIANIATGPIIASHSNARKLCNHRRNLTDEQLKVIGETGGIVGLNSFNEFVDEIQDNQTVENLAKHLSHIIDIVGIDSVGFGFDFFEFLPQESKDGYSFQETTVTKGLEDCTKVPDFAKVMWQMGFSETEIKKIQFENWHRLIEKQLK